MHLKVAVLLAVNFVASYAWTEKVWNTLISLPRFFHHNSVSVQNHENHENHEYECKPFHEIYTDGTDMCESMWGEAFQVVADTSANGYTMGFYDSVNPNTALSKTIETPWNWTITGSFLANGTTLTLAAADPRIKAGSFLSGTGIADNTKVTGVSGALVTVNTSFTATYSGAVIVHGFEYVENHPTCNLKYYHLDVAVTQEPGAYSACHSYNEDACCAPDTLTSWDQMNQNYGEEYHVDRCGPLSEACEDFFMMEACLYECDPSAGLYRRYSEAECNENVCEDGKNMWEMYKMPIRQGFCDNWYQACYNDYFCSVESGNFFECAKIYVPEETSSEKMNRQLITVICVTVIIGSLLLFLLAYVIYRERKGQAVFTPLMSEQEPALGGNRHGNESVIRDEL